MATAEITSPKKRSLMPSGGLRRALRGHGHGLAAIVQIGKLGVTRGVVQQVQQALADHELIKIKIGSECPLDRYTVATRLVREPGVSIVQVLGRVILAYKRHPSAPRYEGKRAKVAADAAAGTSAVTAPPAKAVKPPRRTTGKAGARARASR
jgi:RNA-binding protein